MNNQKTIKRYLNQVYIGYQYKNYITYSWVRCKIEFNDGIIKTVYQYNSNNEQILSNFYENVPPLDVKTEWCNRTDYPTTDEEFSQSN